MELDALPAPRVTSAWPAASNSSSTNNSSREQLQSDSRSGPRTRSNKRSASDVAAESSASTANKRARQADVASTSTSGLAFDTNLGSVKADFLRRGQSTDSVKSGFSSSSEYSAGSSLAGGGEAPGSEHSLALRTQERLRLRTPPASTSTFAPAPEPNYMDADAMTDDTAWPSAHSDALQHHIVDTTSRGVIVRTWSNSSAGRHSGARAPHEPPDLSSNLAGSPQMHSSSSMTACDGDARMVMSDDEEATPQAASPRRNAAAMNGAHRYLADHDMRPASPGDAADEERRRALITKSGGKRFTFGPRADCANCLARVPGHYLHIETLLPDGSIRTQFG